MAQIRIERGELIPELESGLYTVRLTDSSMLITSLTPSNMIRERLSHRYNLNKDGNFKQIYDDEKGAIEPFIIEGPFKFNGE